ncbi:helix-turn-helix domain-containing protein [Niallia circulans]
MEEKLYSIGEVAKVANITIKALRHYDKIGLFKPAYVDPKTNYRYYRDTQLYRLDIIKLLISIGTPLGQIKEIQETDNLDFVAFLKKQEELISEKIASLLETQQSIRELREELQRQEYPFGEIVLMEKEDQAIIQTSVKNIGPQNILNPSYSNLKKQQRKNFATMAMAPLFHSNNMKKWKRLLIAIFIHQSLYENSYPAFPMKQSEQLFRRGHMYVSN